MSRNVAVTATQFASIGRIVVAYFAAQAATFSIVTARKDVAERKLTLALAKHYKVLAKRAAEFDSDAPFREASAYVRECWKENGGNVGTCSKMLSHLKALATADKGTPEAKIFAAYCAGRYPVSLQEAYKTRKTRKTPAKVVRYGREVRTAWGVYVKACRAHGFDPRKVALALTK